MSLEAVIQQNTDAINRLIGLLSNATAPAVYDKPTKANTPEKPPKGPQPEPGPMPTVAPSEAVSYEDAKKAILKLSAKDRNAAVALLAKYGAKKLPDVKPENFADIVIEATEALE